MPVKEIHDLLWLSTFFLLPARELKNKALARRIRIVENCALDARRRTFDRVLYVFS